MLGEGGGEGWSTGNLPASSLSAFCPAVSSPWKHSILPCTPPTPPLHHSSTQRSRCDLRNSSLIPPSLGWSLLLRMPIITLSVSITTLVTLRSYYLPSLSRAGDLLIFDPWHLARCCGHPGGRIALAAWLAFSPRSLGCPGVPSYLLSDIGQDPFIPISLSNKGVGAG